VSELPRIISADDHVVEPANVWVDRLPARYRDVGPRIVRAPAEMSFFGGKFTHSMGGDGPDADWWLYEDLQWPHTRLGASAGFEPTEIKVEPITYDEMRPGCYGPAARLDDMDLNWVEASLCFPTFPRFCGQTFLEAKDKELARLCVQAYNDWMVEEWCAGSHGRLLPLCLVPLWDADLAAAEVARNAARGVRGVAFSEIPAYLGLPSIHSGFWDVFFQTCEETGTVLFLHIGSGTKMPRTSDDAPDLVAVTIGFGNCVASMADFIFSGLLDRYPGLKLVYSEGQIGWIPFFLERADDAWEKHRGGTLGQTPITNPPSYYYYRQIYGCFFKDFHGVASLKSVGLDNVTFECDYPHADSSWPHTVELAQDMFVDLDASSIQQIVSGNARKLLGL
jgi:predicted TIM-barrel fold metal-dependent hydrolase